MPLNRALLGLTPGVQLIGNLGAEGFAVRVASQLGQVPAVVAPVAAA